MVIGIGTDLIEIGRVEASIERFGERFLERIFTPGEIAYCLKKKASAESFAARLRRRRRELRRWGRGSAGV
jgi:holo-[acyl-carrier protein] synthase